VEASCGRATFEATSPASMIGASLANGALRSPCLAVADDRQRRAAPRADWRRSNLISHRWRQDAGQIIARRRQCACKFLQIRR
jgi:hypothetical protein